jgi:hypothetical protein
MPWCHPSLGDASWGILVRFFGPLEGDFATFRAGVAASFQPWIRPLLGQPVG